MIVNNKTKAQFIANKHVFRVLLLKAVNKQDEL